MSKVYFQWYKWQTQTQIALCLDFLWSHVLHKLDGHTVSNMLANYELDQFAGQGQTFTVFWDNKNIELLEQAKNSIQPWHHESGLGQG